MDIYKCDCCGVEEEREEGSIGAACVSCVIGWMIYLKTDKEPVATVPCSDGLDAHTLKGQLDRLLCVVNAVTCPHRHGQPVRPKDLTRLANRQIEVEEALREMGN